ncbi:uncharacterized protein yc1106_04863 [Curvularia clavata]|uniref:Uncharacterized protein n=1 Tax=Curvularia clavata TaxID=95742 RepID=A0A9Q9DTB2_CURCL|nr:uncharacterized protein yc1106_04863 [Curvularia clavata]
MPFIQDEPRSFVTQPRPPSIQANYLSSSAAVPPAGYAISTAATCSCVRGANGAVTHACTTASYIPQPVVAPPQDATTQNADLVFIGGQFDNN